MISLTTPAHNQESPPLVVGASGRLGNMLMRCWPAGAQVLGSTRGASAEFIQLDLILAPEKAVQVLTPGMPLICMAGVTPAAVAQGKDVYSGNTDLALAAIRAAHQAGAGRVFLTSSAAVYSGTKGPLDEQATLNPVSDYGQSKARMEQEALALGNALDHPVTVLRIGNVAGADVILGGWQPGMTLDQLQGGGTPTRSYIGPQTLAHCIHALTRIADLPPVLNVAAPGAVQMGALLDAAGLAWSPRPAPPSVIADVTLCTKRLEEYVPFTAQSATPQGIVREWRAYQDLTKDPSA